MLKNIRIVNIITKDVLHFISVGHLKIILTLFLFFVIFSQSSYSQVENLQIAHPVYKLLERYEARGYLPNMSLNDLPWQRSQVVEALNLINKHYEDLGDAEQSTLDNFLYEFDIKHKDSRVVFASSSDSTQILFDGLFSDDEKFIYRYRDSLHSVSFLPLAAIDVITRKNDDDFDKAIFGHFGFRLFGTLGNALGYNFRVTNGAMFSGNRDIALIDHQYAQNIKFAVLNSDVDYTESHLRYQNDWFYAGIGREARLTGAGYKQRLIVSDNSPAFDAIMIGARFEEFEYKFMHASLLSMPETFFGWETGPNVVFTPKYMVTHRFSFRPSWGEVSFWENIIYSGRYYDLAYLNPLSFLKSTEHSLRDRDNAGMGVDATVRIVDGFQIKGTYFLDDIIFSEIGNGFWGNKSAYNIGFLWNINSLIDLGAEYASVEPYTFSHFNLQNSMTNDAYIVSSYLQPNSDRISLFGNIWWGSRYPIEFNLSYMKHGRNIYNEDGELVRNVGGSALQTRRVEDDGYDITFLDGDVEYLTSFELKSAYELIRGFNIQLSYTLYSLNSDINHYFRFIFRFDEF